MWSDIQGNLLAQFLGSALVFLAGFAARGYIQRRGSRRSVREARQHAERARPDYSAEWIRRYYLDRGRGVDLYETQFPEGTVALPVLTKAEWTSGPYREDTLCLRNDRPLLRSIVPEDDEIVDIRRRFIGLNSPQGRLWNDDLLCVRAIRDAAGAPELELIVSTYFQYLTACGGLEEETYRSLSNRHVNTPIRDRALPSVEQAANCILGAHGLGMQVALVFKQNDSLKVLIQRRSMTVATYGGSLAVVPVFACQPFFGATHLTPSLFHNFIREYYEELYSADELMRPDAHLVDTWFYDDEPVRTLLGVAKAGGLRFEILGIGIDALNGEVNLAALALITDEEFIESQIVKMQSNWEIDRIEIVDLDSEKLRLQILGDDFQPGSAFALSLAIDRVVQLSL